MPDLNNIEKFLEETPCGYVLAQLIEKIDIQSYSRLNILNVIKNLEWTFSGKNICLDVEKIIEGLNRIKKYKTINKGNNNNKIDDNKKLSSGNNYSIFAANDNKIKIQESDIKMNFSNKIDNPKDKKQILKQQKNFEDSKEFNSKYILNIELNNMDYKIYEEKNVDYIKDLIEYQKDYCKGNWNLYSNDKFISNIFKSEYSEDIISIYILSFMKVVETINLLFKNLKDNIGIIPYSIRCICKIIYSLLKKRFPEIKKYQLNTFLSRFFFNKILIPYLENPILIALINEYMISPETIINIKTIIQILSRLLLGKFFTQNEKNGNYTPFNKYMLEISSETYKLYENIEDVILPDFIQNLIEEKNDINFEINNEPIILSTNLFCVEELYTVINIIKKNKNLLFTDERAKILEKIIAKFELNENMKILEEIIEDNNNKKKKDDFNPKKKEIRKYFLIKNLILNKEYSYMFQISNNRRPFQINEIENPKSKDDINKNIMIKVKNLLCTILFYIREINISDFYPLNESLLDSMHIIRSIEKSINTSCFSLDDTIPLEWFINTLREYLAKLPKKYIENDHELLYSEIKNDITKSSRFFDLNKLSKILDKLKYETRKKNFYENAEERIVDITLNEKIQYIINEFKVPCEIYFIYNEKEQKIIFREITKENHGLQFLDTMIFKEESKNKKACITIKDFINYFPNLIKRGVFLGQNLNIIQILNNMEVISTINNYLKIIKTKLGILKIWHNDDEFNIVNNKIYDFITEKLHDKIFPNIRSDNDIKINNICLKLSWVEPINLIRNKKNYILDSILPIIISNFKKIDEEKSPRKNILNIKNIFKCIDQAQNFDYYNKKVIGTNELIDILSYSIIKAQPKRAESNILYLKLFVKPNSDEDFILSQIIAINGFIMNLSYKNMNVSKEEFDANCEKAYNDIIN